jgi:hypothetical protein
MEKRRPQRDPAAAYDTPTNPARLASRLLHRGAVDRPHPMRRCQHFYEMSLPKRKIGPVRCLKTGLFSIISAY